MTVWFVSADGMGRYDVVTVHASMETAYEARAELQAKLDETWKHGRQSPIRALVEEREVLP